MNPTYTGILRDDRIEWTSPAPNPPPQGVRVEVTLLETMPAENQGQRVAAALARGTAAIADPVKWQRQTRQEEARLARGTRT